MPPARSARKTAAPGEDLRGASAAPPMVVLPPEDDPRVAGWLVPGDNCTQLGYELVLRSACDEGIWEVPWGSNKGTRILRMGRRLGYAEPVYWCGVWVACVYADRGALVPRWAGAVDEWLPFASPATLATLKSMAKAGGELARQLPGSAIIYGKKGTLPLRLENGQPRAVAALRKSGWDGVHMGIITRAEANAGAPGGAAILTREGNRGYGIITNNGVCVDEAPTERHDVIAIHVPTRDPNYRARRQIIREALEALANETDGEEG